MGTCPKCGVAVAIGYPRCPKCQTVLPTAARAKRTTFREENLAGGTSIAAPEPSSRASWLVALALLLVGIGIAAYFATRGAAAKEEPAVEEPASDEAGDDDDTTAEPVEPDQPAPSNNRATTPTTGEPRAYTARQVMKRIDDALRAGRLWAKVSSDDDVLIIESSLCDEPGVKAVLTGEVDGLRAAGFVTVRCQSPNGQVEFENGI